MSWYCLQDAKEKKKRKSCTSFKQLSAAWFGRSLGGVKEVVRLLQIFLNEVNLWLAALRPALLLAGELTVLSARFNASPPGSLR